MVTDQSFIHFGLAYLLLLLYMVAISPFCPASTASNPLHEDLISLHSAWDFGRSLERNKVCGAFGAKMICRHL